MSISHKKKETEAVEELIGALTNIKTKTFDSDIDKYFKGDTSTLNDTEKSYWHYVGIATELLEKVNIDKYEGKIDNELFAIAKDLYYNLYLFVDGLVRVNEIALGQARQSLLSRLEKVFKVYDYQMDVAGGKVESLSDEIEYRVKELYPGIEV